VAFRGHRKSSVPGSAQNGTEAIPYSFVPKLDSILAEIKLLRGLAAQRILDELLATLRTEIEPELLIHVVTHRVAAILFHPLENILHLLEVVAVIAVGIHFDGIDRGIHLDLDDVAEVVLGVDRSLAQIT
jgi:hypothetical protein